MMTSLRLFTLLIGIIGSFTLQSQSSNIYIFDYNQVGEGMSLADATILTAFNAGGRNVHPSFINDHRILISSDFFEEGQTDIIELDMKTQVLTRLTQTAESEFYPEEIPGDQFSVLLGGNNKQIHTYPLDLSDGGRTIVSNANNYRAYTWLPNRQTIFINNTNGQLSSYNLDTAEKSILLENVKSNILIDKYKNVIVAQQESGKTVLKKYDTTKLKYKTYGKIEGSSNILAYLPNHKVLTAVGSKLYLYNLVTTSVWDEVADLTEFGIDNITDLKVRNNQLIVVAE
jgi:hypothetical protein